MPLTKYELEALAVKSEEERAEALEGQELSRQDRRRLDKAVREAQDDKLRYKNKLTTREDVVQILMLTLDRTLIEARLKSVENYIVFMEKPFYRRWWIRLWMRIEKVVRWAEEKFGFTLVSMEKDDGLPDHTSGDHGGEGPEGAGHAPSGNKEQDVRDRLGGGQDDHHLEEIGLPL